MLIPPLNNQQPLQIQPILLTEIKPTKTPSRKASKKLHNYRQQIQQKNSTSVMPFFKITKARSHQKKLKQEQFIKQISYQRLDNQQELIKKNLHNCAQEQQNNISRQQQIGSEYGDYNYDNELHQVLKNNKNSPRQVYNTPKVIFRVATCQNQLNRNINNTQYQRFEKFKTQIHEKDQIKRRQLEIKVNEQMGENNCCKKMQPCVNLQIQRRNQHNNTMSKYNIKQHLQKYDSSKFYTQPIENDNYNQQTISSPYYKQSQQQSNVFGNFLHIINKKISPTHKNIQYKKYNQHLQTYRRSRTQRDDNNEDNFDKEKSQQIFENYKKLKQTFRRISSTYKQRLNNNGGRNMRMVQLQLANKNNKNLQMKKQNLLNSSQQLQGLVNNDNVISNNSITNKIKPSIVFEDFYQRHQFLTTRACITPKQSIKCKINDIAKKRMISKRQKDFFQQQSQTKYYNKNSTSKKSLQSPVFTFEQIKSKLKKLQQIQNSKRHNKSLTIINNINGSKDNLLVVKDLLVGVGNNMGNNINRVHDYVQVICRKQEQRKKQKGIKTTKGDIIKKNTEFNEKQMKRRVIRQTLSQVTTPKASSNVQSNY